MPGCSPATRWRSPTRCAPRRTCCTASAAARSATAGSSSPTSRTASSAAWSQEGQDPLHVAAEQLTRDGVDVLHTIGGDDTNGTAADLAAYLHSNGYELTVVGLPKTIDNDVIPIRQSLGAWTAAEQGAIFARNVIAEHSANPRMLIVHEVMGRNCGWLTAATALAHHQWVQGAEFSGWLENSPERWDVHGVFVPERPLDIAQRGRSGCAPSWTSSTASTSSSPRARASPRSSRRWRRPGRTCRATRSATSSSTRSTRARGSPSSSPTSSGADKVLVQKSGYFARSAAANDADLALIKDCTTYAVDAALRGESGVVGHDEERGDALRAIEFDRIKGGKAFDPSVDWFTDPACRPRAGVAQSVPWHPRPRPSPAPAPRHTGRRVTRSSRSPGSTTARSASSAGRTSGSGSTGRSTGSTPSPAATTATALWIVEEDGVRAAG